ncbi:hypothetical protein FGB62_98g057 [Gracilaria domingensis]|nr:hypothetical protein FGB62_98g057 [Gracilaria domingensis]
MVTEPAIRNRLPSRHSKNSNLCASQTSSADTQTSKPYSELVPSPSSDESFLRSPHLIQELNQQSCICPPRTNWYALTSSHGRAADEEENALFVNRVDSPDPPCVFYYALQEFTHRPEAAGRMLGQTHEASQRMENKHGNSISFVDSRGSHGGAVHGAKELCSMRNSYGSLESDIHSGRVKVRGVLDLNANFEGRKGLLSELGGNNCDERHPKQEACLFDLEAMFERNIFVIDHLIYSEYGSQICGAPTHKRLLWLVWEGCKQFMSSPRNMRTSDKHELPQRAA